MNKPALPTVLITGVSDGIGHALAVEYANTGARVLGVGRRAFPASLSGKVQPGDYCVVDLGDSAAATIVCDFLAERAVDALDVLVHNAAMGWYGPAPQQSPASIDELLIVNLYAPIALTHTLLPRLRARSGVLVFISSVHSALPAPEFAVYTASKAALDGFARNLRLEERGTVDVVVLWPGPTRTQMHVKSGIPRHRIQSDRYATPAHVAREGIAAISRRHSGGIGLGNRALRWMALRFETQADAIMAMLARRSNRR
jgi:short-subunit dehydrogenase